MFEFVDDMGIHLILNAKYIRKNAVCAVNNRFFLITVVIFPLFLVFCCFSFIYFYWKLIGHLSKQHLTAHYLCRYKTSSFCSDSSVDAELSLHRKLFYSKENQKQKMKVLRHFVQIAALFLLLTVIVQSASTSPNAAGEGGEVESRIVKRGIFDCPHDCWGDSCEWNFFFLFELVTHWRRLKMFFISIFSARARARCGNNYREISHPTCCGKCYCC